MRMSRSINFHFKASLSHFAVRIGEKTNFRMKPEIIGPNKYIAFEHLGRTTYENILPEHYHNHKIGMLHVSMALSTIVELVWM